MPIHTIALSVYLPLFFYATNPSLVEIGAMWRAVFVAAASALLAVWVLRVVIRDLALRAVLVSILFVSFALRNLTGSFLHTPMLGSLVCLSSHPLVELTTVALACGVAFWLRGERLREGARIMSAVAIIIVGITSVHAVTVAWSRDDSIWKPAVQDIQKDAAAMPLSPPLVKRDIYYIVIDSYPRADVFKDMYGVESDPLAQFLRDRGFHVATEAVSNYPWTLLSLASSLNMTYLDSLASVPWRDTGPTALIDLIQRSTVAAQLRDAGYRIALLSSGQEATSTTPLSDVTRCGFFGLTEYEAHLLSLTPLNPMAYAWHRSRVRCQLDELPGVTVPDQPTFVFAHIMTPHPPFVFGHEGCAVTPTAPYRFADGACSMPSYVEDFRNQAEFLAAEIRTTIDTLVARSAVPPIVIVQSDHGPGSQLHSTDVGQTNLRERFSIVSAYLLPDTERSWARQRMSPVNNFRVVFNEYFGTHHPLLADRSYFAPRGDFHQFTEVTDRLGGLRGAVH